MIFKGPNLPYIPSHVLKTNNMKTLFTAILSGMICLPVFAQSTWQPVSSVASQRLNDVVIASSTNIYVGGDLATFLRSTDGGLTFSSVMTPISTDIVAVCATSALNVFALSQSGVVIHSTDGGNSWTGQNLGIPTYAFSDIQFSSPTNGLIIYEDYNNLAPIQLFRTVDGGTTWNPVVLQSKYVIGPGDTIIMDACYQGLTIDFINGNTGFMSVGKGILKTTDGGGTWTPIISFMNPNYAASMWVGGNSICQYFIDFWSTTRGVSGTHYYYAINYTHNGGQNMNYSAPSAFAVNIYCNDAAYIDSNRILFVGENLNEIRYSSDGGMSSVINYTNSNANGSYLRSVDAFGSALAIAVGDGGSILRSNALMTLNEKSSDTEFKLYPSLTSDIVHLDLNSGIKDPCLVLVFDAAGNEVKREILNPGFLQINVSDLAEGLYFISVNGSAKRIVIAR
jgi:photosystem II stability/assembly factor-like uncharacterized protein